MRRFLDRRTIRASMRDAVVPHRAGPAIRRDHMSGPDAVAPPEATTSNAMRWAIIILLAVGALIAFVDRTSISAAIASKPFKEHFHLTDLGRGWLNSAFFWSYALLQIPMGFIVDRYGVKWPYTISFVIWCVASMLTAMTTAL